jgi:glucose-6-phosphate dehydrogenase assembly protein OpcA
MSPGEDTLLPGGVEVPVDELASALSRLSAAGPAHLARSLTATILAVGTRQRLAGVAADIEDITATGSVRAVLITTGDDPAPVAHVTANTVALEGLRPSFVNNAVASLRLSSLPTLVWWRGGGRPELLAGVADLADRVVLDVDDPRHVWERAPALFDRTAMTDLRWTRLTPWRALMAHFFDIDEVRAAASTFTRLIVRGADRPAARLFAGWLQSSLQAAGLRVEVLDSHGSSASALESVELGNDRNGLLLRLRPNRTCVETVAHVDGRTAASRVVSVRQQGLASLIREELRVRSRDLAFERAVTAAGAIA